MGNTKSHFRKLSRRNSFNALLRPGSSRGLGSSNMETSEARTGVASRSHSLASNTTGGSDISRLSVPDTYNDSDSIKEQPATLTSEQLSLVKYSWHLVSLDTSNVCLNFFHQLQRQLTPRVKKSLQKTKNVHSSTPSLHGNSSSNYFGNGNHSNHNSFTRNRSCTGSHSSQTTASRTLSQGQLSQQALKLACCLDAVIGSLTRNSKVKEEKLVKMLLDNGYQFKTFLGVDNFYTDSLIVREMTNAFCESLRLVVIQNGLNWSQELQEAWDAIFRILLFHLDGLSEIYDDDDMMW